MLWAGEALNTSPLAFESAPISPLQQGFTAHATWRPTPISGDGWKTLPSYRSTLSAWPTMASFSPRTVARVMVERGRWDSSARMRWPMGAWSLSTLTLATVLGEKEAIVGQALSVLRYEGKVYQPSPDIGVGRHVAWAVKPCCDGEIGADSKASGEVFKASPAHSIRRPVEEIA